MPARRRILHGVVVGLALACAVLLVLLVFFRLGWQGGPVLTPRFDLERFVRTLPRHGGWFAAFVALSVTLAAFRALVWRTVVRPDPRWIDAYHATAMGALVHNTLPGKLGPVAAAWLLARMERRPFPPLLSSQLLAKLLEMGALVALAAAGAAALPPEVALGRIALAGAGAFVALAGGAAALAFLAPGAALRLERRFPRLGAFVEALGQGLRFAGRRRLALAAGLAVLPAAVAGIAYAVPLARFDVPMPLAGGAVLVGVIAFGQLTPGLPVGTGVYWALTSWGARRLGADADDAAALTLLSHLGMVTAQVTVGSVSALLRRGALRELVRRRKEVAAAPLEAAAHAAAAPRSRRAR